MKRVKQIIIGLLIVMLLGGAFYFIQKQSTKSKEQGVTVETQKQQENKSVNEQGTSNVPTEAPQEKVPFTGVSKFNIQEITESKLEQFGFTKEAIGDVITYKGKVKEDHVLFSLREGKVQHMLISPYDFSEEKPHTNIDYIQYADVYDNNEIAISEAKMIHGVPDYENIKRTVLNPDGSYQYATENPNQNTRAYYEKVCAIIKQFT